MLTITLYSCTVLGFQKHYLNQFTKNRLPRTVHGFQVNLLIIITWFKWIY